MVDDRDGRDKNYEKAIATTKAFAKERNVDPWPLLYRVSMMLTTESGGRQYANDGKAFHPDAAQRRPGWADGWTADQCQPVYEALRKSLDYPHDAVGNNGGSTGCAQGLSVDYLTARFGKPTDWGWGTIAQQLDPVTGVDFIIRAFLGKLRVTNDPVFVNSEGTKVRFSDPITADVLRVQRPLVREAKKDGNYSATRLAQAKRVIDNWHPRFFTDGGDK